MSHVVSTPPSVPLSSPSSPTSSYPPYCSGTKRRFFFQKKIIPSTGVARTKAFCVHQLPGSHFLGTIKSLGFDPQFSSIYSRYRLKKSIFLTFRRENSSFGATVPLFSRELTWLKLLLASAHLLLTVIFFKEMHGVSAMGQVFLAMRRWPTAQGMESVVVVLLVVVVATIVGLLS